MVTRGLVDLMPKTVGSDGPGCRGMDGTEQNPEVSWVGSTPRGRMFPFPWRPPTSKAFGTTDRQHSLSDELGSYDGVPDSEYKEVVPAKPQPWQILKCWQ